MNASLRSILRGVFARLLSRPPRQSGVTLTIGDQTIEGPVTQRGDGNRVGHTVEFRSRDE